MKKRKKIQPITLLFLGFFILIIVGACLLMLPFATKQGQNTSFIDALFISASAACVTGLSPFNTFEHWTLFGQIVILILIQIGGLGFMTIISVITWIVNKSIDLYGKSVLMQSAGTYSFGDVRPLLKRILIGTFIFETIGTILISVFLYPTYGPVGIYFGLFTSISAFCNAGFDLFSNSLVDLNSNPGILATIAFLIVIGGMGFLVWSDIIDSRFRAKKLQMHSKVVLTSMIFLIFIPALMFFIFDFTNISHDGAFSSMPLIDKITNSIFLSITPRTAGFYSVDLTKLTSASKSLIIILMFIGGNSGSTAGGLKVTTFIVIFLNLISNARGKDEVCIFKQKVNDNILRQSSALFISYLTLVVVSVVTIASIEDVSLESTIFECVSALSTVGLSLGITSSLSIWSKIVLILLMYVGRLGAFGLFTLVMGKTNEHAIQHAEGRIMVG